MTIEDVLEALNAGQAYRTSSLDAPLSTDSTATRDELIGQPDPRIDLFIDSHALAPALAALPRREYRILTLRFYQDMTQSQIAEELALSQMHISRPLGQTLVRLRAIVDNDLPPSQLSQSEERRST